MKSYVAKNHQNSVQRINEAFKKFPISKVWLGLFTILLSFSWLMPGHFRPWSSFQSDAWISLALLIAFSAMLAKIKTVVEWTPASVGCMCLSVLPLAQYFFGVLPFAGQAWISALYIFGFGLTLVMGGRIENSSPNLVIDVLFTAILMASGVSIYLEFATYLSLYGDDILDIWTMGLGTKSRPYANFGQPNVYATFLTWGCLASLWFFVTGKIRGLLAVVVASIFLLGISLTQSRVVKIELAFIVAGVWWWRDLFPSKRTPLVIAALFIAFLLARTPLVALLNVLLQDNEVILERVFLESNERWAIWKIFSFAAINEPWFGYGWTETYRAHINMSPYFASVGVHFGQSHNLFLDLILWCGIVLGVTISLFISWVIYSFARSIKSNKQAVLLMFVVVAGIHSMLELPLHYGYILFPVGLVLGVLGSNLKQKFIFKTSQISLKICFVIITLLFTGVVRDYFLIENEHRNIRLEVARNQINLKAQPLNIIFLTQLEAIITFMRYPVHENMKPKDLHWLQDVALLEPNSPNLYKTAKAMALNGSPIQAKLWFERLCKTTSLEMCTLAKKKWLQDSLDTKILIEQ